jgi:hypothetical protein
VVKIGRFWLIFCEVKGLDERNGKDCHLYPYLRQTEEVEATQNIIAVVQTACLIYDKYWLVLAVCVA